MQRVCSLVAYTVAGKVLQKVTVLSGRFIWFSVPGVCQLNGISKYKMILVSCASRGNAN